MWTVLELTAAFFLPAAAFLALMHLPDFIEAVIERIRSSSKNDND